MSPRRTNDEQELSWVSWVDLVLADAKKRYSEDVDRLRESSTELLNKAKGGMLQSNGVLTEEATNDIEACIEKHIIREIDLSRNRLTQDIITTRVLVDDIVKVGFPIPATTADQSDEVTSDKKPVADASAANNSTSEETTNKSATSAADRDTIAHKETATKETTTNETASNGTATSETATNETAANETATKETATKETATRETTIKETAAKQTATKKPATDEPTSDTLKALGEKIWLHKLPVDKYVVEYPRRSKVYYVLDCPICKVHFEMVRALYSHITISHHGILTGDKAYTNALKIGGTLVLTFDPDGVAEHNRDYNKNKNIIYEKVRKAFQASSECDDKDKPK